VARPRARRKQEDVDADILAIADEAWGQHFGRAGNALEAARVDGELELGGIRPPFDLDERYPPPAPRDQIALAHPDAQPPSDDPPPAQPQPPRGERLAPPPSPLGLDPARGQPLSSSARA